MTCQFRYVLRSRSRRRSKVQVNSVKPGDMDALKVCGECKVCYDLPVRTVFVNCGHIELTLLKEHKYEHVIDDRLLVRGMGDLEKQLVGSMVWDMCV